MAYDWHQHGLRDPAPEGPHGWVQWKGTDACMDLYCKCGRSSHVDADFFYFFQCPECHQKYQVGQHVLLFELPDGTEPENGFISGNDFCEEP